MARIRIVSMLFMILFFCSMAGPILSQDEEPQKTTESGPAVCVKASVDAVSVAESPGIIIPVSVKDPIEKTGIANANIFNTAKEEQGDLVLTDETKAIYHNPGSNENKLSANARMLCKEFL